MIKIFIKIFVIFIFLMSQFLLSSPQKVLAWKIEDYQYSQLIKELNDYQNKKNEKQKSILEIEKQLKLIEKDIDSLISDIENYNNQIQNLKEDNERLKKEIVVLEAKIATMENEGFYFINLISYINSKVNLLNEKQKLKNKQAIFKNNEVMLSSIIAQQNKKLEEAEDFRIILTEIYNSELIELNELNTKIQKLILTERDLSRYVQRWYASIKNMEKTKREVQKYCDEWLFDCKNTFVNPIKNYIYKSQWFHSGHLAVDLVAPQGTDLISIDDWIVVEKIEAWYSMPWNWLYILHPNGFISIYWHVLNFNVNVWDIVKKGDIIGKSGWEVWTYWAWRTTWPHLHFGIMLNWRYLNPDAFFSF